MTRLEKKNKIITEEYPATGIGNEYVLSAEHPDKGWLDVVVTEEELERLDKEVKFLRTHYNTGIDSAWIETSY